MDDPEQHHLWRYRELMRNLILRDFRIQFGGRGLSLWICALQPLVVVLIYLFGLRAVLQVPMERYPLFLAAGCLHWNLSSSVLLRACRAVTGNANLVTRARFPLVVLPLSCLASEFLTFLLSMVLFGLLFPWLGGHFWSGLLLYPLVVALNLGMLVGLTLLVSAWQVFYDELQEGLGLVMRVWFWFSPVIYTFDNLSSSLRGWLLCLNPMVAYLDFYRDLLYFERLPDGAHWLAMCGWAVLSLVAGWSVFTRLSPQFADEL